MNYSKSAVDSVDWDSVHEYSKNTLERVSTMGNKSKDKVQKKVEKTQ